MVSVEARTARKLLDRLRLGDLAFRHTTRAATFGVPLAPHWRDHFADCRLATGFQGFRLRSSYDRTVESGHEKFGALAPIDGTLVTSFIAMPIAVPVGLMIASFGLNLPAMAAAADRHRH